MGRATFTAAPGLDQRVARMVAPKVRDVAVEVERNAKRFAPPGKRWVSMEDNLVRDTHRAAHLLPMMPANLRFAVPKQQWDADHGLGESGGTDYLLRPKDTTTGLPLDSVQHVHCRCVAVFDPLFLASKIVTGPAMVAGSTVTVRVACVAYKVVEAEVGDTYPTGTSVPGTRFMARAAARAAGRLGAARAPDVPFGNDTVGGENQ